MPKKIISNNKLSNIIKKRLDKGQSKSKIYQELSNKYSDKYIIASILANNPSKKLYAKYKNLNTILIILLLSILLLKLIPVLPLIIALFIMSIKPFDAKSLLFILLPLLSISFYLMILKLIISKQGSFYLFPAAIFLLYFSWTWEKTLQNITIFSIILFILAISAIIISIYLRIKMFPELKLFGIKEDDNGNYIFKS